MTLFNKKGLTFWRLGEGSVGQMSKNILQEWSRVKNLSSVNCAAWHVFTINLLLTWSIIQSQQKVSKSIRGRHLIFFCNFGDTLPTHKFVIPRGSGKLKTISRVSGLGFGEFRGVFCFRFKFNLKLFFSKSKEIDDFHD